MTEHLPECMIADFENGRWICICNALRACEERVLNEALDAVQEAVYKVKLRPVVAGPLMFRRGDVLFAIDALRKESDE